MYCKYCGSLIDDDSTFCSSCGKPVAQASVPAAPTPDPASVPAPDPDASAPAADPSQDPGASFAVPVSSPSVSSLYSGKKASAWLNVWRVFCIFNLMSFVAQFTDPNFNARSLSAFDLLILACTIGCLVVSLGLSYSRKKAFIYFYFAYVIISVLYLTFMHNIVFAVSASAVSLAFCVYLLRSKKIPAYLSYHSVGSRLQ